MDTVYTWVEEDGELVCYANRGLCIGCHAPLADGDDERCPDCAAIRARPFCPGCGYYFAVHAVHRDDCTATPALPRSGRPDGWRPPNESDR